MFLQSCFPVRRTPRLTKHVQTEWNLFYSAVITSAALSYGCKHMGGQTGNEKKTDWWNQEVKETIYAKKSAFRACLTNKSSDQLQLRYSAGHKTAANIVK